MTFQEFDAEVRRLESQWPHGYGAERKRVLFRAFRDVLPETFRDAVSELLASSRQAPLLDEIEKACAQVSSRENERLRLGSGDEDPFALMAKAAQVSPNREFAAACMSLVSDKLSHRISPRQFDEAVTLLKQTAERLERGCWQCHGSGYMTAGDERHGLYRCDCPLGAMRPAIAYGPRKADGTRDEIFIPIYKRAAHASGRDRQVREVADVEA